MRHERGDFKAAESREAKINTNRLLYVVVSSKEAKHETQKALPTQPSRQRYGQERRSKDTFISLVKTILERQQREERLWRGMAEGQTEEGEGQQESRRKEMIYKRG